MSKVIVMPKLGLTMTEGLIGTWYKEEGETVEAGENLFSVETDKLTNEVESTESGVLRKIIQPEGETVLCLEPVGIIARAEEDISDLLAGASQTSTTEEQPVPEAAAKETVEPAKSSGDRVLASPAARRLAREKGIDLAQITGSGPRGRITIKDIEDFQPPAAATVEVKETEPAANQEERIPMSPMRKIIASRMSESWTHPAATFDISVDVSQLAALKASLKETCKVSYTDLLIKITARALMEHPQLNASIDGEEIILKKYVNIGFAVGMEDGLLVPVIKDAQDKGLETISKEVRQLAKEAREGKLSPDALTGGTFSISNLGMFDIDTFSPIINLPEVAILGVSSIKEELALVEDEIIVKPVMKLSLTADHRAVDGAVAAAFLKRLKELLENPSLMML